MYISVTCIPGICALLMLVCSGVYAESDHPIEAQYITLDEAITNTLESNPYLLAFGYQLDIKRSRVQQAGLAPNPELLVTVEDAFGTGEYQGFRSAETTVSLGWVFERAVRESRVYAAQTSESLSAADIEILRVDFAAETANRFLALMANQARAETANEAVDLLTGIDTIWQEKAEDPQGLRFDVAVAALKHVAGVVLEFAPADVVAANAEADGEEGGVSGAPFQASSAAVNNRADVVRLIDNICEYYTTQEPSSPIPLLLRRAQRLVEKSFMEILEDIVPTSLDQVKIVSGETDR